MVLDRAPDAAAFEGHGCDDRFEDDALPVLLRGTASPLAQPDRAKGCVAVFAAGRPWVVDTGPGSWKECGLASGGKLRLEEEM